MRAGAALAYMDNGDGTITDLNTRLPAAVATYTWSATGNLSTARDTHTATLLPNGTVLVAGGSGSSGLLTRTPGTPGDVVDKVEK